jgi:hypothetical protein
MVSSENLFQTFAAIESIEAGQGRLPTYWRCGGPVYRRHDSYLGFRAELEIRVGDAKGEGTSGESPRPKVPMY